MWFLSAFRRFLITFMCSTFLQNQFDPVTLEGGASWTGDMALKGAPLN